MLDHQMPQEPCNKFERLNLGFVAHTKEVMMEVEPTLEQDIRKGQKEDKKLQEIKELMEEGKAPDLRIDDQGTLWLKDRICVPNLQHLRDLILKEAQDFTYSIHHRSVKMY